MDKRIILIITLVISITLNLGLIIALIIVSLNKPKCESANTNIDRRIVGGVPAYVTNHKHIAAIVIDFQKDPLFKCATTIISKYWTVTAGTCIQFLYLKNYAYLSNLVIKSGSTQWKTGKVHKIKKYILHPGYNYKTYENDIGLIKVKNPFIGEYEVPIHIAPESYEYLTNSSVAVTGWGRKEYHDMYPQNSLRKIIVLLLDQRQCENIYEGVKIFKSMFCAGFRYRHACLFDTGGPVTQHDTLIGIISWGHGCNVKGFPEVYTRVSFYKNWIINKVREN